MIKKPYGQYAINCYLDYFNNYLSLGKFAESYNISLSTAYDLINRGRKLYNQ